MRQRRKITSPSKAGRASTVSVKQHRNSIFPGCLFLIDRNLEQLLIEPMAKLWTRSESLPRALLAGAAACLILLQALAFVVSPFGRFAAGGADGSIAMEAQICGADRDDGGAPPAAPGHHAYCHHCILCASGDQVSALTAMALLACLFILLAPRSDLAPVMRRHENKVLWPSGFASSWTSRAPPLS
jgi:hypothetical protein